ncbi:MAG: sugar phosphate isomerase/epimerase [Armatimonadetes bacterium]|nr:sugar phosphate isomerase/epimerase [Armatimonadota bacterium]MDW8121804.1 sugar phosphate isomerase/epimerase family protein [Armatimonadota bacterium]
MSVGCASLLFAHHHLDNCLMALTDVGLQGVDLWAIPNWAEHIRLGVDDPAEIKEKVQQLGLKIQAVSVYTADRERLALAAKVAAQIGAPMVVNGAVGRTWDELKEFLDPALKVCDETGVKIAVENHTDSLVDTIDRMEELTRRFPKDRVGIAFAPPHSFVVGEPPHWVIRRLWERILLLYLWDVSPRNTGLAWWRANWHKWAEEQFPGAGRLDFLALADALSRFPFQGELVFCAHGTEPWDAERLKEHLHQSLTYLRSIGFPLT